MLGLVESPRGSSENHIKNQRMTQSDIKQFKIWLEQTEEHHYHQHLNNNAGYGLTELILTGKSEIVNQEITFYIRYWKRDAWITNVSKGSFQVFLKRLFFRDFVMLIPNFNMSKRMPIVIVFYIMQEMLVLKTSEKSTFPTPTHKMHVPISFKSWSQ